MLDTAFFGDDYKARLLATFDDLDAATDGVLIHGENFQALSLLRAKYREQVGLIYIDPPYNTGAREFMYKDNYKHSSWLTMMADRMGLARQLLDGSGVFFTSIDDGEQARLRLLMDELYTANGFLADVIWHARKSVSSDAVFSLSHHHTLVYCKDVEAFDVTKETFSLFPDKEGFENPDNDPRGPWKGDPFDAPNIRPNLTYPIENPNTGEVFWPPEGRCWRTTREEYERLLADDRIIFGKTGTAKPQLKRFWSEAKHRGRTPTTIWSDVDTTTRGTQEVQSLFGYKAFDNPKPVNLIRKMIELSIDGICVLDFFAGSGTTGHAVMSFNKEYGGNRTYTLVEMGDYFDTVLKPRIQKVAFSTNWKEGVPQDRDGMSHMFKYQRIESYEDALNNIRVQPPAEPQLSLLYDEFDDYMLSYMLDFETRGSPTLLTQDAFETPFDYKLDIQHGHESPQPTTVDLVETFHYLLGMHVRRLERHQHQDRKYVVSRGEVRTEHGIESVVVIWRDRAGLDLEREADWTNSELLPEPVDRVYVNGESFIDKAEPLEFTFRDRMEASLHAK